MSDERKIIQILSQQGLGATYLPRHLLVLCDDGTVWEGLARGPEDRPKFFWEQVKIPPFPKEK